MSGSPLTPLELDGWLEFNAGRTGLAAHRFSETTGGSEVRAVLYLDRRGRVTLPPHNPYLPLVFDSARPRAGSRTSDWLRATSLLVDEMKHRGVANLITFPPGIEDVRPWRWKGFLVGVRYSTLLDFPFDPATMDAGARRNADKAERTGLTIERSEDTRSVAKCLEETAANAGIPFGIGGPELETGRRLLGSDTMRMYICRDARGGPAASCVVLHAPGARALWWQSGTSRREGTDGASQLMWQFVFDDLAAAGATGIDGCGANLESVAEFKLRMGSRVVPTYTVRTFGLRTAARFVTDWLHAR